MNNSPKIDRIEERTNKTTGELFSAIVLKQLLPIVSVNGNTRFAFVEVSVPSAESVANLLPAVGMQMPGSIVRVNTAAYKWTSPSGEELTLSHTYVYRPNGESVREAASAPEHPTFAAPEPQFDVESTAKA